MYSAAASTPLVILDRDGVINEESDQYIKAPAEWHPIKGSLQAIARLNKAGYRVVVATNQEAISRGLFDATTLLKIHTKMHQGVSAAGGRLDAIYFCPHGAEVRCHCRKPEPGMLLDAIQRFQADASQVHAVGDSWRDLQAAVNAGCKPVLVRTGNGRKTLTEHESGKKPLPAGVLIVPDLATWVSQLLNESTP